MRAAATPSPAWLWNPAPPIKACSAARRRGRRSGTSTSPAPFYRRGSAGVSGRHRRLRLRGLPVCQPGARGRVRGLCRLRGQQLGPGGRCPGGHGARSACSLPARIAEAEKYPVRRMKRPQGLFIALGLFLIWSIRQDSKWGLMAAGQAGPPGEKHPAGFRRIARSPAARQQPAGGGVDIEQGVPAKPERPALP